MKVSFMMATDAGRRIVDLCWTRNVMQWSMSFNVQSSLFNVSCGRNMSIYVLSSLFNVSYGGAIDESWLLWWSMQPFYDYFSTLPHVWSSHQVKFELHVSTKGSYRLSPTWWGRHGTVRTCAPCSHHHPKRHADHHPVPFRHFHHLRAITTDCELHL